MIGSILLEKPAIRQETTAGTPRETAMGTLHSSRRRNSPNKTMPSLILSRLLSTDAPESLH